MELPIYYWYFWGSGGKSEMYIPLRWADYSWKREIYTYFSSQNTLQVGWWKQVGCYFSRFAHSIDYSIKVLVQFLICYSSPKLCFFIFSFFSTYICLRIMEAHVSQSSKKDIWKTSFGPNNQRLILALLIDN